jgi:hypothetical protein
MTNIQGATLSISLTRDAYWPSAPLAPLDKPVLFEPDPERGVIPPVDLWIVCVLKSGMSACPPRIIAPSVGYVAPGSSCTMIRDVA